MLIDCFLGLRMDAMEINFSFGCCCCCSCCFCRCSFVGISVCLCACVSLCCTFAATSCWCQQRLPLAGHPQQATGHGYQTLTRSQEQTTGGLRCCLDWMTDTWLLVV